MHQQREGTLRHFHPTLDVDQGVPTCARCKQSFTCWANLRRHIEMICIHARPQAMTDGSEFRARQQTLWKFAGQGLDTCVLNRISWSALGADVHCAISTTPPTSS